VSKILVVHFSLSPGGSTEGAIGDAVALRNEGFEVGFASEPGSRAPDVRAHGMRLHRLYFVDSGRYPAWVRYLLGAPVSSALLLYFVVRHGYRYLYVQHRQSGIPSTVVAWLTGAKYVFISRSELGRFNRGRFLTPLGRHILAVSEQGKRNLMTYFRATGDSITVVPNATRTDVRTAGEGARRAFRARWNIAFDQPIVACVAMLVGIKAHDVLLAAWAQVVQCHSNAVLVLAGDGPLKDVLRRRCRELEITDSVRFLGLVDDVSIVYSCARFVVLASRSEGLPRSILEASAHGLPSVATAVSGVPEIVIPERTGLLVEPGEPKQLAQAMMRLLSDAGLRDRLGGGARELVIAKHSMEHRQRALSCYFRSLEGA
jgi:glycosyltransferase involved in cell wall biosynthesis